MLDRKCKLREWRRRLHGLPFRATYELISADVHLHILGFPPLVSLSLICQKLLRRWRIQNAPLLKPVIETAASPLTLQGVLVESSSQESLA